MRSTKERMENGYVKNYRNIHDLIPPKKCPGCGMLLPIKGWKMCDPCLKIEKSKRDKKNRLIHLYT